jgi:hypothetical protein
VEDVVSQANRGVRVICDDQSHEPKIVLVHWLEFMDAGEGRTRLRGGTERLIDDAPIESGELFGTVARPPVRPPADMDRARSRYPLECRLCGLRVEMRAETAGAIAHALLTNGVAQISLRGLAAIVGR